jgi:hypothetical protein
MQGWCADGAQGGGSVRGVVIEGEWHGEESLRGTARGGSSA